ncbi:MAG: hypothetical protein J6J37_05175 [Bacteroidaceae bacterium]|nr:hypothetical protein [Bacteroidaceae bacterium]
MKRYTILSAIMLAASNLFAQNDTIGAVIQVENNYAPVVVKATKMGFTPQIEIASDHAPLNLIFSQKGEPFKRFVSQRNVKDVLPTQEMCLPGYARLGYGTGNNLDLKAAYRFSFGKRDRLTLFASMDGYNTDIDYNDEEWRSRFYTTEINADYTHNFDNLTLGVEADIKNSVFNYMQPIFYANNLRMPETTDKQNCGYYALLLKAASNTMGALSYKAYAGFTINNRKYSASIAENIGETRLRAGGTVRYELAHENLHNLGANIDIDGFIHNSALKPEDGPGIHDRYSDYALIRLNPFGNLRFGEWKGRLGIHADLVTANSPFLAVAPDIRIEGPLAQGISLYAAATGGRKAASFETLDILSPYWNYIPGVKQPATVYNLCDISAGVRTTIGALYTNIYAGFSYTIDDLMPTADAKTSILYTKFIQDNSRDIYIGIDAGYDFGGIVNVEGNIRYDRWGCSDNDDLLMYKPMLTAGIKARARIIEGLYANVGYTFTGYTSGNDDLKIEDKSYLEARISYRLHKQLNLFLQGNNLLDCEYELYPGCLAQGANAMVGASINF